MCNMLKVWQIDSFTTPNHSFVFVLRLHFLFSSAFVVLTLKVYMTVLPPALSKTDAVALIQAAVRQRRSELIVEARKHKGDEEQDSPQASRIGVVVPEASPSPYAPPAPVSELAKREKKPRHLPHLDLNHLEEAFERAKLTGATIVLNSPRSVEACKRAGIEAQELLPTTFAEVLATVRKVSDPAIRRAVADKRFKAMEEDRKALMKTVKGIRERLVAMEETEAKRATMEQQRSLSRQGSAPSTTSRGKSPSVKQRKDPSQCVDRFYEKHDQLQERRWRIEKLQQEQAEQRRHEMEERQREREERYAEMMAMKQAHAFSSLTQRQRTASPAPRLAGSSPARSRGSVSLSMLNSPDHQDQVRHRADRIQEIREQSLRQTERQREDRIAAKKLGKTAPSPSRSHSAGYNQRREIAAQRAAMIENLKQEQAVKQITERESRIIRASETKTRSTSATATEIAMSAEERAERAWRRRELLAAYEEEQIDRKLEERATRINSASQQRSRSQDRAALKRLEQAELEDARRERAKQVARQVEDLRIRRTENLLAKREADLEAQKRAKELQQALAMEERQLRASSQARRAERQRKAVEYIREAQR